MRGKLARGEERRGRPGPQPAAANMLQMVSITNQKTSKQARKQKTNKQTNKHSNRKQTSKQARKQTSKQTNMVVCVDLQLQRCLRVGWSRLSLRAMSWLVSIGWLVSIAYWGIKCRWCHHPSDANGHLCPLNIHPTKGQAASRLLGSSRWPLNNVSTISRQWSWKVATIYLKI